MLLGEEWRKTNYIVSIYSSNDNLHKKEKKPK